MIKTLPTRPEAEAVVRTDAVAVAVAVADGTRDSNGCGCCGFEV